MKKEEEFEVLSETVVSCQGFKEKTKNKGRAAEQMAKYYTLCYLADIQCAWENHHRCGGPCSVIMLSPVLPRQLQLHAKWSSGVLLIQNVE